MVPKKVFREQRLEPQQGMIVDFSGMKGRIQSVAGNRVRVDFNNPLAGKKLVYDIAVIEKIEGRENQVKVVFEFFGIRDISVKLGDGAEIEAPKMPVEMKDRISQLMIEHVHVEKVRFVETYEKKAQ
jgi:FKBP-type peptidyl-prolyl cis-trans isomerase 2